jgi:hypothetical protein
MTPHTQSGPDNVGAATLFTTRSSDSAARPSAGVATLERAPLVFAHTAPDAGILTGFQRPGEALGGHRAPVADQFRVSDLRECRPAVSYREEQFRILVATHCPVAPIHTSLLLTMRTAVHNGYFFGD